MSSARLGPISYIVLGLLALRGPSTPYQLKRAVSRSVGNFWPVPHSQFYKEPPRLVGAGLLSEEREASGRHRRVYALSAAGREALEAWLRTPVTTPLAVHDLGELQLFFSELVDEAAVGALAAAQVAAHRALVARYRAFAAHNQARPFTEPRMAPLALGLRLAETALAFWEEVAASPSRADCAAAAPPEAGAG